MNKVSRQNLILQNHRAFTLLEAVVTVVLVTTIASLAIANLQKTLEHAAERQAMVDLMTIVSAEKIYFAKNNRHWPTHLGTPLSDIEAVNDNLGLNLPEPSNIQYTCETGGGLNCEASYNNDKWVLSAYAPLNGFKPYCSSGSCPSCKSATTGGCF